MPTSNDNIEDNGMYMEMLNQDFSIDAVSLEAMSVHHLTENSTIIATDNVPQPPGEIPQFILDQPHLHLSRTETDSFNQLDFGPTDSDDGVDPHQMMGELNHQIEYLASSPYLHNNAPSIISISSGEYAGPNVIDGKMGQTMAVDDENIDYFLNQQSNAVASFSLEHLADFNFNAHMVGDNGNTDNSQYNGDMAPFYYSSDEEEQPTGQGAFYYLDLTQFNGQSNQDLEIPFRGARHRAILPAPSASVTAVNPHNGNLASVGLEKFMGALQQKRKMPQSKRPSQKRLARTATHQSNSILSAATGRVSGAPHYNRNQSPLSSSSQTNDANDSSHDHIPNCRQKFGRLPCLFQFAGCTSQFSTKNEWKRHMTIQHLLCRWWVCLEGGCIQINNTIPSEPRPMGCLFSRGDLYRNHYMRNHLDEEQKRVADGKQPKPGDKEALQALEMKVDQKRDAACIFRRSPPLIMKCHRCCDKVWEGDEAWDRWVEHVFEGFNNKRYPTELPVDESHTTLLDWCKQHNVLLQKMTPEGKLQWTINEDDKPANGRGRGGKAGALLKAKRGKKNKVAVPSPEAQSDTQTDAN